MKDVVKKQLSDEKDIYISDIMDVEFLQKFQDAFSKAIGVSSIVTDTKGNPITQESNFCDFCKINRKNKEGLRRCMQSDAIGGEKSAKSGRPAVYYCSNGLIDFAAPITINGKQIGSFLGGQTLPEVPNKEKYHRIAQEIDVDPKVYIEALEKVQIVPDDKVRAAADLLYLIANELSKMGYQRMMLAKIASDLSENINQILAKTQELTASATTITTDQEALNNEINGIKDTASQITDVSTAIKRIANETHLLGINAAIEAARSGHYGLGFGVVSKEIQRLSEDSKTTVNRIMDFAEQINGSVMKTSEKSRSTLMTSEQQESFIKNIVFSLEGIMKMAEVLNQMTETKRV